MVCEVASRGPPKLRHGHSLRQIGQLGEHGFSSDTCFENWSVERSLLSGSSACGISALEPDEVLQRRQDGADGAAQVVGGGAMLLIVHVSNGGFNRSTQHIR